MYGRLRYYMFGRLYKYGCGRLYWYLYGRLKILQPYHSYITGSERCGLLSPAWKGSIMLFWTGEVQRVLYRLVLLHNGAAVSSFLVRRRESTDRKGRVSWPICTALPAMGSCRPSRHTYSPMGTSRSSR